MNFESMTNDEIGVFVADSFRKSGKELWVQAQAIRTVYTREKGNVGAFKAWHEKHFPRISQATIYRYLKVSSLKDDQIGTDEGLTALYRRIGILKDDPKQGKKHKKKGGTSPVTDKIAWLADHAGNDKNGLTKEILEKMPDDAIDNMIVQMGGSVRNDTTLEVIKAVAEELGLTVAPDLLLTFFTKVNNRLAA